MVRQQTIALFVGSTFVRLVLLSGTSMYYFQICTIKVLICYFSYGNSEEFEEHTYMNPYFHRSLTSELSFIGTGTHLNYMITQFDN